MRCVDCRASFKVKDIESTGEHCPGCGHRVVAVPKRDGISDGKLLALLKKLSTSEAVPVCPEHLAHALPSSQSTSRRGAIISVVIAVLIALAALAASAVWIALGVVVLGLFAVVKQVRRRSGYADRLRLTREFLRHNGLPGQPGDETTREASALDKTLGRGAKRAIVTNDAAFAKFLHQARFPWQNACPVLGPDLDELTLYPGLKERIGSDAELVLLLVTDYTPAGNAFRDRPPATVAHHPNVQIIGMHEDFVPALGHAARPVRELVPAGISAGGLSGKTAELFAVAPAAMLGLLAVSLDTFAMAPPEGSTEGNMSFGDDAE